MPVLSPSARTPFIYDTPPRQPSVKNTDIVKNYSQGDLLYGIHGKNGFRETAVDEIETRFFGESITADQLLKNPTQEYTNWKSKNRRI